ncbi:helix-turn-helix domain-containing protein [Streptomyces sp. NPDC090093]|uniref:helix-turn-helix domain-containing protein n=1 Tax=Streptomyces sp. NPDC090093 TaxID=3365945 RepID=UPI003825B435
MSLDAREWVWEHSRSKGTARMVLALIADRCVDRRCVAYASVPTLMRRANASRTAVRDALDRLVSGADPELVEIPGRKGPRGEKYYHLPVTARFLADAALEGDLVPAPTGTESDPVIPSPGGPEHGTRARIPTLEGTGFRPEGSADSDPQNGVEPKVNGQSSSSTPPVPAAQWEIDEGTRNWLRAEGHHVRLGEQALRAADEKWRAYRAASAPRSEAAWAADWRAWITRERPPAPGHRALYALPGGATASPARTRSQVHSAALLAALEEPTGTE